jgi:hypothetical protein
MSPQSVRVSLGALSPTIDEQLREQGFKLDMDPLQRGYLQRDADCVSRLLANHILTLSEAGKARQRIFQIIKKQAKPL